MLIRSSDDEEKSVLVLNTEKEEIQQIYKIYTVYSTYKLALVVCVKSCVYFILSSNVLRNGHYLGMQFTRFLEMK